MKRIDCKLSPLLIVAFCGFVLALGTSCQRMVSLLEVYVEAQDPDRNAQKRTVADIRNTGTAMFSWLTDQVGAAAAGQSQVPQTLDLAEYASISHADLATLLVPMYMQEVPEIDGWNSPYEFYLDVANPLAQRVMGIRSPGRDGWFSDTVYTVEPFDPESFDEDIVWADGFLCGGRRRSEGRVKHRTFKKGSLPKWAISSPHESHYRGNILLTLKQKAQAGSGSPVDSASSVPHRRLRGDLCRGGLRQRSKLPLSSTSRVSSQAIHLHYRAF